MVLYFKFGNEKDMLDLYRMERSIATPYLILPEKTKAVGLILTNWW